MTMDISGPELDLSGANHIFYVEMDSNPTLEEDCTKMIYRPTQKQKVVVHRMVTKATVEERMLRDREEKAGQNTAEPGVKIEKKDIAQKKEEP